jgi:hypothetical protein
MSAKRLRSAAWWRLPSLRVKTRISGEEWHGLRTIVVESRSKLIATSGELPCVHARIAFSLVRRIALGSPLPRERLQHCNGPTQTPPLSQTLRPRPAGDHPGRQRNSVSFRSKARASDAPGAISPQTKARDQRL